VQEADRVGDLAREPHFVGGDQHRHSLVLERPHGRQHLADQLGVEGAGDLVEQHRPRAGGEGAGDRDPLALAAGEQLGVVVLAAAEPESPELRPGRLLGLLAGHPVSLDRAEDDVLEHGQVGEEVVGLKDQPEPPPHRDRVDGRVGDHLAVEQDVAVVDLLQQVDAAQHRRLARARGADHRHRLVLGDGQVDPVEHLQLAERLGDAAQLQHRRAAHRRALRRSQRSSNRAIGIVTQR